ncbi:MULTISPECIES: hypothetical protein [unclassified Mycobacterium]|uniref:hypothetical protein n=1 Tax=unclassified Mycobacterium TaxID=2642494 RepID=UPI00073FFAF0|nr:MULTISPECIES: hypothetical protein [unclassified Mycobacterium]KUH82190.1 hypothetical protein AU185_21055 [Mycobacterium sp. GA-0227b]KUH85950.1 hypothetical protein AU186_11260 [Mycobacterium sp. GA-1999]
MISTYSKEFIAATVAACAAIIGFNLHPSPVTMWWTFIPCMVIAYCCHLASTARHAADPARILPIYLIALAWQFLHFADEFQGGFYRRWPEDIFGARSMSTEFFVWGNMASYAVFALAGLAMYLRLPRRVPMLIVWFFAVMGVMGNAISHTLYCFITGDLGFPGFWTSLAYWIIGPVLIYRLWTSRSEGHRVASDHGGNMVSASGQRP